jgi:hypothetical protein
MGEITYIRSMNHYSFYKNEITREKGRQNFAKYGTFEVDSSLIGKLVIGQVVTIYDDVEVRYLAESEVTQDISLGDSICGHNLKIINNALVPRKNDLFKITSNAINYVNAVNDLAHLNLDIETSVKNLTI